MPLHLETERLVLTPEVPEDAGWFAELLTERGAGAVTVADARARIAEMTEVIARTGIGVLVLRPRGGGEPLGYCGLVVGRATLEEPELAYELLSRAHGRGYATEAARAVLGAAFVSGRARVWATVRAWNAPSFRVLEKLGFTRHRTTVDDDGELVWLVRERRAGPVLSRAGRAPRPAAGR